MYTSIVFRLVCLAFLTSKALSQSTSVSVPPWPVQTFVSEPLITTPQVQINKTGPTSPGYLFFAPDGGSHPNNTAPVIKTDSDDLIWYGPKGHAFAFSPQTYNGQTVLAYWTGQIYPEPVGVGYGRVIMLDSSYTPIANISLGGNWVTHNTSQPLSSFIDLHEIFITNRDTVLVTANNITKYDLSSIGGPKSGYVVDCRVYEIGIKNNSVVFEWSALDHLDSIPFNSTYYTLGSDGFNATSPATAWSYFHINSVTLSADESYYVVSSRYTCTETFIDAKTGNVLHILQGRDTTRTAPASIGTFSLATNSSFCYQHDVRLYPSPDRSSNKLLLSMHDNANSPLNLPNPTVPSSGLLLSVDLGAKTATALARYVNLAYPIYATALGSYQALPPPHPFHPPSPNATSPSGPTLPSYISSHVLVGHGFTPIFLEFSSLNQTSPVMTAQFGPISKGLGVPAGGVISYRAFRSPWVGCPKTHPKFASTSTNGGLTLYVSWNGATEVSAWQVSISGQTIGTYPKTGFETIINVTTTAQASSVQVKAVAAQNCGCADFATWATSQNITVHS